MKVLFFFFNHLYGVKVDIMNQSKDNELGSMPHFPPQSDSGRISEQQLMTVLVMNMLILKTETFQWASRTNMFLLGLTLDKLWIFDPTSVKMIGIFGN